MLGLHLHVQLLCVLLIYLLTESYGNLPVRSVNKRTVIQVLEYHVEI